VAASAGFALSAILVLALGLGASTALFAALDRVLFRTVAVRGSRSPRLCRVGNLARRSLLFEGMAESMVDAFYVQEWDTTPTPFQSVTALFALVPGIRNCEIAEGQPEGLRCDLVEHNFLRVLGERVALGRDFAPEDDVRGAPPVALISHALWVRRFGADPGVVDRTLSLEGGSSLLQVRVIGVLPPDFEMPFETADILLPAQMRPSIQMAGSARRSRCSHDSRRT
jgi:putative ABC transport system permease protein